MARLTTIPTLALLAALAASPAAAQTASWTFATVDDIRVQTNTTYTDPQITVTVSGIVEGEDAPSTHSFTVHGDEARATVDACQRMALLAIAKPGQYRFTLSGGYALTACKLARVTP